MGGVVTLTLADAVFPVPPFVAVTAPDVFVKLPAAVAVTLMLKVHEEFVASVAPANEAFPDPATAVIVPPPQVPVNPFGVATTNPTEKCPQTPLP